jgi:hypothetical protein
MAFLVYSRSKEGSKSIYQTLNRNFRLAGYNLLWKLWSKYGRPLDYGWHAGEDDLLSEESGGELNSENGALLIDFTPRSTTTIGLVRIEDIYLYTYSDGKKNASWTPLMIRLRDAYYDEEFIDLKAEQKNKLIRRFKTEESDQFILEFLYLNGDSLGWNWGKNGMTNAAFIHKAARDYFRQFF